MRGRGPTTRRAARARIGAAALATSFAVLLVPGLTASPVAADCAGPATIQDAQRTGDILFVGSVVRLENDNRWIKVLVEERWQNADGVPDTVDIRGGPEAGISSSTQRAYTQGRYLFDVTNFGPFYQDTSCSATTLWTDDLARYRPSNVAQAPNSSSGSPLDAIGSSDLALAAVLVLALLIAVVAYILILRRRKRPPDWMR
jgi:hypothetical protein